MAEALISIVVPVYNVERYLKRCVESIRHQSYQNLEIILVDDGSTDSSGKLCEELAAADKRIQVIHKENSGLSDARNTGMEHAAGEYLAFVDSDDYLDENYVQYLYEICVKYDADIAICRHKRTAGEDEKGEQGYSAEVFTNVEALEQLLYQKKFNMSACTKLCKRALYEGITFPKGEFYEDVNTTYKVIERAKRVGYCSNNLYFYFVNPKSITCNGFHEGKMDYITHMEEVLAFVRKHYPALEPAAEFRYIWANIHLWVHMPPTGQYKKLEKQVRGNIKKYRQRVLRDRKIGAKNRLIVGMTYGGHRFMRLLFRLAG